jgi:hypothetical protein
MFKAEAGGGIASVWSIDGIDGSMPNVTNHGSTSTDSYYEIPVSYSIFRNDINVSYL